MAEKTEKNETNWKDVVTHIVGLLRSPLKADPNSAIGANNQRLEYADQVGADPQGATTALRTWQSNPYGQHGPGGMGAM